MAKGWWISERKNETWVVSFTEEMSCFPQDGIANHLAIKTLFDEDNFANSAVYLKQGPLGFAPEYVN